MNMNTALANGAGTATEAPNSPATSGAMDSLLEKLRAAAPQARDQRDRRRRARLKERHNVRVASGQQIPENFGAEEGAEANEAESNAGQAKDDDGASAAESAMLSPPGQDIDRGASPEPQSESEDVADRAASMLQGLRDNSGDAERSRRRRESAEEERRKRRMRRRNGPTSGSKDSGDGTGGLSSVKEPEPISPPGTADSNNTDDAGSQPPSTPAIVVSPNDDDQHVRSPDDNRPSSKRDSEPE